MVDLYSEAMAVPFTQLLLPDSLLFLFFNSLLFMKSVSLYVVEYIEFLLKLQFSCAVIIAIMFSCSKYLLTDVLRFG